MQKVNNEMLLLVQTMEAHNWEAYNWNSSLLEVQYDMENELIHPLILKHERVMNCLPMSYVREDTTLPMKYMVFFTIE